MLEIEMFIPQAFLVLMGVISLFIIMKLIKNSIKTKKEEEKMTNEIKIEVKVLKIGKDNVALYIPAKTVPTEVREKIKLLTGQPLTITINL